MPSEPTAPRPGEGYCLGCPTWAWDDNYEGGVYGPSQHPLTLGDLGTHDWQAEAAARTTTFPDYSIEDAIMAGCGTEHPTDPFTMCAMCGKVLGEAAAPRPGEGLDEAWAEAEAALPEGWEWGHLQLQVDDDGTNPEWHALVGVPTTDETMDGYGHSPAAALHALSARLRENTDA